MNKIPEQDTPYHTATKELPLACSKSAEEQCEHLEELVSSSIGLLQDVITEFNSPTLNPLLGTIIAQLHSITAFMETELANASSLKEHK